MVPRASSDDRDGTGEGWKPEHPVTTPTRLTSHPGTNSHQQPCTYLSTYCALGTSCVPGTVLTASHSPSPAILSTAWKEGSSALPSHGETEDLEVKALPQSHPPDPKHPGGDTQTTPSSHCRVCGDVVFRNLQVQPTLPPLPESFLALVYWNQCHINIRDRLLQLQAGATWLADAQPCPREGLA